MRTFPIFAVLFFALPLIEIYFLIQVGEVIGALPTILLVVLTAVLGAVLLRQQGLSTLARFQQSVAKGEMPAAALLEGVMLLIGGILLMTPGFFTDAIGFACLLPYSRIWLAKKLVSRGNIRQAQTQTHSQTYTNRSATGGAEPAAGQPRQTATLEGDYVRKD